MNITNVISRKIVEQNHPLTHSFFNSFCLLLLSEMHPFHGCLLFNATHVYDYSSSRPIKQRKPCHITASLFELFNKRLCVTNFL